jgi:hypothetical protein
MLPAVVPNDINVGRMRHVDLQHICSAHSVHAVRRPTSCHRLTRGRLVPHQNWRLCAAGSGWMNVGLGGEVVVVAVARGPFGIPCTRCVAPPHATASLAVVG